MDGQQSLSQWIDANMTQAEFARAVECSQSHLSLVLKGERGVSLKLAKRISEATGGAVPIETLARGNE